jgi:hypothetical protein
MHAKNISHRDLKPENFMFMEKNVIKNIILIIRMIKI